MFLSLRFLFLAAVWRVLAGKASLPYKSDGNCNNSTEYYNKELHLCCSKCKPGTRLATRCTTDKDTVCSPCQNGQYSETMNHYQNCFSCHTCLDNKGLMYERTCSADSNAVCACKPGMFCIFPLSTASCERCRLHKFCKPGEYVTKNGTPTANVQCGPCPNGSFSSHRNTESCKPHTRCEGRSVLSPGNSTADTQCEMTPSTMLLNQMTSHQKVPVELQGVTQKTAHMNFATSLPPSTSIMTSTTKNQTSVVAKPTSDHMTVIYCVGVVVVVLLFLIVTVMVKTCKWRNRKGLMMAAMAESNKPGPSPPTSITPERQCLLPGDRCQKEPSMTSSDSQSQPDSSQSHSSGDWIERTSQAESLPEHHSVSSPLVNLSITATINCQLNPVTASCSIPVGPSALTPQAEAPVPLSQEEVCISCQQEDGKEALQSVQESGLCAF